MFTLAVLAAALATAPSHLPLLVGGHAHGGANIRILKDLGLGNFVWIPKQGYGMGNTPWDAQHDIMADVDACIASGMYFMISQPSSAVTPPRTYTVPILFARSVVAPGGCSSGFTPRNWMPTSSRTACAHRIGHASRTSTVSPTGRADAGPSRRNWRALAVSLAVQARPFCPTCA